MPSFVFAFILLLLALGYALQRVRALPAGLLQWLNTVVLYVCMPATVLRHVPKLEWDPALFGIAALPWLLVLATLLLVALVVRLLRLSEDARAVLLLAVALGNTSFLGYPLVRALLGEEAVAYAVVYDQLGSFLIMSTFGLWVLARYGGDGRVPGVGAMLARIVTFPPVLAMLFAVTLMPAALPAWIDRVLQILSDALLPLAMLVVGLSLRLRLPRAELAPLAAGLALKLAVMPALAWLIAPWLGLDGLMVHTAVLEAAMPPMITAAALAIAHGLAPRLAAALVGYGVLLSLCTLPLWVRVVA